LDRYEGFFSNNLKQGKGVYHYKNGDIYEGKFEADVKEDENCVYKFSTSSVYQGGIKLNRYHGKGKLTIKGGLEYYDGYFNEGKK
jgi:hypothetical protein